MAMNDRFDMNRIETRALSRRSFLVASGGTAIGVTFGTLADVASAATGNDAFAANAWVNIGADGMVTIMQPASEMGQGAMTVMPMMIAEELDADWRKVRVVPSPDDAKIYGNPVWNGDMTTFGSGTVRGYWEKARLAGAQARKVLLAGAAAAWNVPVAELTTRDGIVIHQKSGRKIGYGALARTAKLPDPLPEATKDDLKPASAYRLIGKDLPRVDVPQKVNGTAKFGIDTQLGDMLYAAVLYPPVPGEKAVEVDDNAAKAVKDIVSIMPMPFGVAVVGRTVESTRKAKALLKATWTTTAKGRGYTTKEAAQDYLTIARDWSQPGVAMFKTGDAAAAMSGAAKTIVAEYTNDHVSHVTMEPLNATAIVRGDKVEVWASNQSPSNLKRMCARAAGVAPDNVKVNTPFLGGGFGRRSEGDDAAHAVAIAKLMPGTPIKLIRSREDDIANDFFRAMTGQRIEVGLDASGNIQSWRHRIVGPSSIARSVPPQIFEQRMGGKDGIVAGFQDIGYAMPNRLIDYVRAERGQPVGAWRGTWSGYSYFAVETMIDEVAALNNADPVAFRLGLLKDTPRGQQVLRTVADMAGWGKRKPAAGRALGVAYTNYGERHQAIIVEVSLDKSTGAITVHAMWAAVHPGRAIHPHNAIAQMEGAMMFGLGAALYEHIDIVNGEVQQTNFDRYRVLRMADVPPVEIKLISSDEPPGGMGEAGVPGVAPAIANAVAALTDGKRLRQLPMLPERVKAVVSG